MFHSRIYVNYFNMFWKVWGIHLIRDVHGLLIFFLIIDLLALIFIKNKIYLFI